MASIPIVSGIYTDAAGDFRVAYPRNLVPVFKDTGIGSGYLRSADGISSIATGPGTGRGGINWNGALYRVMGDQLVRINAAGAVDVIGYVGSDGRRCRFDYSFDRLGICSGRRLFYFNGSTLIPVTDQNVGAVLDVLWIDGYFLTTDGDYVVATELSDPTTALPTKYGGSEADPDPIVALRKVRNEAHFVNRYTIEVYENVGGSGFPFARIQSAIYDRGAVGRDMVANFMGTLVFVGSRRNEPPAVWMLVNGDTKPMSTAEVDTVLKSYGEDVLSRCTMDVRTEEKRDTLLIHLPDQTLALDGAMSEAAGVPIWYALGSGIGQAQYRAQGLVWCDDRWTFDDPQSSAVGTYVRGTDRHFGSAIGWEFSTQALYAENRNAIVHTLELVALPGRAALGADPVAWHSYSRDGVAFSQERPARLGKQGEYATNTQWRKCGFSRNWRVEKVRGADTGPVAFAKLEADIEVLSV